MSKTQPTMQERRERWSKLVPDLLELYEGESSGEMLRAIFDTNHIHSELYKEYAVAFGDVILGFELEHRLPALLVERMGISEAVATPLAHDLLEFLNAHKAGPTKIRPTVETTYAPTANPQAPQKQQTATTWSRNTDSAPTSSEPLPIPSYAKPLTDMPKYSNDPYRESPRKE